MAVRSNGLVVAYDNGGSKFLINHPGAAADSRVASGMLGGERSVNGLARRLNPAKEIMNYKKGENRYGGSELCTRRLQL